MKLLFLSTSVGPLGSGLGGGVELTLLNIAQALLSLDHQITVVAPPGSKLPLPVEMVEIPGQLQVPAQTQTRDQPIEMPPNSVLGRMWDYARQVQAEYDILVNFAYDWLPFYLTPFFQLPIAHLVSMGSLNDVMDQVVGEVVAQFPGSISVYTRTQAETFPFGNQCLALGSGLDLSLYKFCPEPGESLCWLGRISPEKGLEDAVAAVNETGIPLKIMGQIQDATYWETIQTSYPNAPIQYLGFKTTQEMQEILRQCRALLVTSRWVEAFGNVLIESLACGVPVIAYARGGPTEIIEEGQTGWLVTPDSVSGLVAALQKLDRISRQACRDQAERDYALPVYGTRVEQWLRNLLP